MLLLPPRFRLLFSSMRFAFLLLSESIRFLLTAPASACCCWLCAEKKCLNSELWHACAGPLVCLPTVGTRVIYFPQGHSEQVSEFPCHLGPLARWRWVATRVALRARCWLFCRTAFVAALGRLL